jgi:hypothetical protein
MTYSPASSGCILPRVLMMEQIRREPNTHVTVLNQREISAVNDHVINAEAGQLPVLKKGPLIQTLNRSKMGRRRGSFPRRQGAPAEI